MPLVIVESPNKCAKIEKILGKNYTVISSVGHIMDLSKKKMGIDTETWKASYVISPDKRDVVKNIKAHAKNHEEIYIATDADREGSGIAFHIRENLPKRGKKIYRSIFKTITKKDVLDGVKNPIPFNVDLYNAQQARRITDRLVGFKVSPVMWNKGLRGTSAGRVQSVALKFIADRESSIKAFVPEEYWEISANTLSGFNADFWGHSGKAVKLTCQADADKVTDIMDKDKKSLVVTEHSNKKRSRKPAPPFITSTLQQSASNSFGWGAKKTMNVAQSLFGYGLITYHRTDSTRSDPQKVLDVRKGIEDAHGKKYLSKNIITYGPKATSQDAHEAIRPTYDSPITSLSSDEKKLLNLVDNRFIASQMSDAQFEQVAVKFEYQGKETYNFRKNGSTMMFDGFLKVYGEAKDDVTLPPLAVGNKVPWDKIVSSQHFTKPPSRFSDASIIKLLEKEGVGRPSTYASIIDTLLKRKYVVRSKKSLAATETGIMVSEYLTENFPAIVDAQFTSKMEQNLDKIADGKIEYADTLKVFNDDLDVQISVATTSGLPKAFLVDSDCPKCSEKMTKKLSKFGPFLACSAWPSCDGTLSIDGEKSEEAVDSGHKCPECSNILIKRKGSRGAFFGCKSYPVCKFTAAVGENDEVIVKKKSKVKKTGVTCPKCKKSEMVERKGRFGLFFGCSGFPKCRNIMKTI